MKTLHTAYRVRDLDRSLEFYVNVGFREVGRVVTGDAALLVMLKLPDDKVVTLELVSDPQAGPPEIGTGFSHIVVQVDDLDSTRAALEKSGVRSEEPQWPGGEDGPKTSVLHDPDGYQIELVEWPPGHPDGITDADFP